MSEAANGTKSRPGGLLDSLKGSARNLVALVRTRLELLASEVEEQREFLLRELLFGLVAVFCLGMGLVSGAAFLVLLVWYFWHDLAATLVLTGLFALAFLGTSAALFMIMRAASRGRPRAFSATLDELSKDRDALQ